ncbi:hypothetical protein [Absidia glauca]|uniref:Letm1 RBD domain-containing protein n=1 Tax=Absidia glauca TaxID=4829 RepID=A0A163JZG4_ABSGL|nr:hypothetical protein [Absidia glauca]
MKRSVDPSVLYQKRIGEGACYKVLYFFSSIAIWSYFRHVKIICRTPIPLMGPVLVASNHTNMVVDPALLIATFPHGRPCHFWALKRFFELPFVGRLLLAGGGIPVDTQSHSNARLFGHTLTCLRKGGVIALFPEGTSYTRPDHLPFKDGFAWTAFEYLSQQKERHNEDTYLPIVPVGITYTTKNKWRSDVVVEYGTPVIVGPNELSLYEKDPKTAVRELTESVVEGVENGTLNAPDWDTTNAASEARFLLFGVTHNNYLDNYVRVSQSLIQLFSTDVLDQKENDPTDGDDQPFINERKELKTQLVLCSNKLKQMKLSALDIRMYEKNEITSTQACLRLVSATMALMVELPLFLPGLIINSPLYLLGKCIDHFEVYTESVAQDKVVSTLTLAGFIYFGLFVLLWRYMNYSIIGFVVSIILVPLFGRYHITLVDKRYDMAKEVVASGRIFLATTGLDHERRELEDAVRLRKWCFHRLNSLLIQLDRAGNKQARLSAVVSPVPVNRSLLTVQKANVAFRTDLAVMTTRTFFTGVARSQQQAHQHSASTTTAPESQQSKDTAATTVSKEAVPEKATTEEAKAPTSYLGKLYQQSKELVVFYKDGLKLLWSNNKQSKSLLQKVQQEGYVLNRSEYQLIHHNRIDMQKLIPFSLIFLILPESIPFFVVFVPAVVPSTCVKESQVRKQREKRDKLRQTMSANVLKSAENVKGISPEDFLSIPKFAKIAKHYGYDFELNQIDRPHLASYCRFMGLNGYGTRGMLKKRLDKHFEYLKKDDKLLAQEGMESLTLPQLQQAIEERGMRSVDMDQSHLRQGLKYWIASQSIEPPVARGLLVFSRMFLLNAKYN